MKKGDTPTNAMKTLHEIQEHYRNDKFATNAGCVITEAGENRVVCEMPLTEKTQNAHGGVMGGAIFTLADLAFAVASNYDGTPTVGVECNIRYFSPPRGERLTAVCVPDKTGRTLSHYTVDIADETGRKVACFTAIAFHKRSE